MNSLKGRAIRLLARILVENKDRELGVGAGWSIARDRRDGGLRCDPTVWTVAEMANDQELADAVRAEQIRMKPEAP